MWPNLQETADSIKFTEEILNGEPYYLGSGFSGEWLNYCKRFYGRGQKIVLKGSSMTSKYFDGFMKFYGFFWKYTGIV